MNKWYSGYARLLQHSKINVFHHINRLNQKNYMILSIDEVKAFVKIQHPFMIKTLSKVGIEGNFQNLIKNIYQKPTAIILNGENPNAFQPRSGARQGYPLLPLLSTVLLETLTNTTKQAK